MPILWPEHHVETCGLEQHEVVKDGARSGVAIRLRDVMIDKQDTGAVAAAVARQQHTFSGGEILRRQSGFPALEEAPIVLNLVGLYASRKISAVTDPLMMHDGGEGLVDAAQAGAAYAKCEIGILAIGRHEQLVEAAEPIPYQLGNSDGGAGDVVDVLDVIELGSNRVL